MRLKSFKIVYCLPALSFWLIFQLLTWQPTWLWWSLLLLLIINFFNLRFLAGLRQFNWSTAFLAAVPALFSVGAILYSSLLINRLALQFLVFLAALIIYQYWRLADKRLSPKPIKQRLLSILGDRSGELAFIGASLYVNFLALFLLASSLLALKYFLGLPYWLMFIALALTVLTLCLAAADVGGLFNRGDQTYFWLIVALVVWQLGVILFFLPLTYSVSGFLLALAFYTVINLGRFALSGHLSLNRRRWYLGFPILATFILLFSARWL